MKYEEEIVYNYLKHIGYEDIQYEPNGNVTPDFLVNKKIAIEVRRLNKHYSKKPLEALEFNLIPKIEKLLLGFENIKVNDTILVDVSFQRPLKTDSKLLERIKCEINNNIPLKEENKKIKITNNLSIKLFHARKKLSKSILLASYEDVDQGGNIGEIVYENLKLIIEEKENKVRKHLLDYPEWWLILVDYIVGDGLDIIDVEYLKKQPQLKSIFSKVIVVSRLWDNNANELPILRKIYSQT